MAEQHEWTRDEDKVAFYLYKHCYKRDGKINPLFIELVSNLTGMESKNLKARISNYKFIDGKGGLANPCEQEISVFEEYDSANKMEFREEVLRILAVK
jgi:hypothetical protein